VDPALAVPMINTSSTQPKSKVLTLPIPVVLVRAAHAREKFSMEALIRLTKAS
jgi:hypothetical protein